MIVTLRIRDSEPQPNKNHSRVWNTIAIALRFLNGARIKNCTNEQEMLGLVWSLDQFDKFCRGPNLFHNPIMKHQSEL